jgi:hypothetical protein
MPTDIATTVTITVSAISGRGNVSGIVFSSAKKRPTLFNDLHSGEGLIARQT